MKNFSRRLPKNSTAVICIAAVFLLFAQQTNACSWDYLIWENRSKNSDPYYRFIKNDKAGFINRLGKIVIEPTLRVYGNYQEGVIRGLLEVDSQEYIDVKTRKKVSAEFYRRNTDVHDGLVVERFGDKFGFADRQGKTVVEPRFVFAREFSEGLAPVISAGPCSYYDSESPCSLGGVIYPIGAKPKSNASCKFNFIDKEGELISAQTFLDAKSFSEGLAPVKTAAGWGYINRVGEIVIAPQFERAEPFSEGLALVRLDDLYGYIDSIGAFVIKPQYERAESFSDGLAPVGRCGDETTANEFYFINKSGQRAVPGKFLLASRYFNGLAHVQVSESLKIEKKDDEKLEIVFRTYAYIDTKGKKIFTYTVKDED